MFFTDRKAKLKLNTTLNFGLIYLNNLTDARIAHKDLFKSCHCYIKSLIDQMLHVLLHKHRSSYNGILINNHHLQIIWIEISLL